MKYRAFLLLFLLLMSVGVNSANGQDIVVDTLSKDSIANEPEIELSDPLLVDEVIAVIGNKIILLSDFHNRTIMWKQQRNMNPLARLSQQEQLNIFEEMLVEKLLAIAAIADSLPVNEVQVVGMVESRINQMTSQLGSTAKVEEMFKAPIYQIREMLNHQVFEESLANEMRSVIKRDVIITPMDVKKTERKMSKDSVAIVPQQISYAHIVRRPPTDFDTRIKVKTELLELRRRIINGDSFSALARMYSHDKGTAIRGGELDYMELERFDQNYANAVRALKVGGTSGIIESQLGYHIIQLLGIKGTLYQTRHILFRIEMDADQMESAITLLDSVANEIREGTITFSEAAEKYSDDEQTKYSDGILLNHNALPTMNVSMWGPKFFIDDLEYDASKVMSLKVGEISDPFISYTPLSLHQVCKIITIIKEYPEHRANFNDDYAYFENITENEKANVVFEKWIRDKILMVYVRIEPPYSQSKFKFDWIGNEN